MRDVDRRTVLGGIGTAIAVAVGGSLPGSANPAEAADNATTRAPSRPPNIVLIMTDDLGWTDLGCYGSSFYETPALDRLAADGVRFTDAYAAAPVCSPARASILTGKYTASVGITQYIGGSAVGELCDVPYFSGLPWSELTLARALRDGGYATWHVGKWHLGESASYPENHGFEVNIGGTSNGLPPGGFFSPYGLETLLDGPEASISPTGSPMRRSHCCRTRTIARSSCTSRTTHRMFRSRPLVNWYESIERRRSEKGWTRSIRSRTERAFRIGHNANSTSGAAPRSRIPNTPR